MTQFPLAPVVMIVAGLAVLAVLFRSADLRGKRGPSQRLDQVTEMLEQVQQRVRDGETIPPQIAVELRKATALLADTLAQREKPAG
jgi:hypothetical protein